MRGMFAAALWTESRRRLVLARDRMGIKPLYYCQRGEELYFGSELKAILEHPQIPRELDLEGLDAYLGVNYVPGERTLIAGIRKLPPGCLLEWRRGKVEVRAWWRLPEMKPRRIGIDQAKEELDGLLKDAVREHLVSDVPLGVWASGGVDSSAVLHYAAAASSGQLKTFSVSFAGRSFDESSYFRKVAEIYGTDHHEFDLNPETELRDAIEAFAYHSDEPSADAGALPVWYLSRMSRRYVTVALSGEGADELFGGYVTYLADRLAGWARLATPAFGRRLVGCLLNRYMPVTDEKIGFDYKAKRFVAGSLLDPDEAHFYWNGTFSGEERRAMCDGVDGGALKRLVQKTPLPAVDLLSRYLTLDQHYYLADDILYKTDRMSMAHSLEVRPPFLDHRIVEFAASLPSNLKIHGFRQKHVLKELMRGKLPDAILNRKKTGFDIPTHDWFRGSLRGLLEDALSDGAVAWTTLFHEPAIRATIRDHMERRINAGYHLWGLLTLFLWMKRWKVAIPEPMDANRRGSALITQ
jgi:asparagine synthase (glutamine-hydrolysing)